jgi:hypothetical protein
VSICDAAILVDPFDYLEEFGLFDAAGPLGLKAQPWSSKNIRLTEADEKALIDQLRIPYPLCEGSRQTLVDAILRTPPSGFTGKLERDSQGYPLDAFRRYSDSYAGWIRLSTTKEATQELLFYVHSSVLFVNDMWCGHWDAISGHPSLYSDAACSVGTCFYIFRSTVQAPQPSQNRTKKKRRDINHRRRAHNSELYRMMYAQYQHGCFAKRLIFDHIIGSPSRQGLHWMTYSYELCNGISEQDDGNFKMCFDERSGDHLSILNGSDRHERHLLDWMKGNVRALQFSGLVVQKWLHDLNSSALQDLMIQYELDPLPAQDRLNFWRGLDSQMWPRTYGDLYTIVQEKSSDKREA